MYIKQGAATTVVIGPFIDITTRVPDPAIDVTDIEVDLYKTVAGSSAVTSLTITASGGNNDMVAIGSLGMYTLELTSSNVSSAEQLTIVAYVSGYEIVKHEYDVIDDDSFDVFVQGGEFAVNLVQINGSPDPVAVIEEVFVTSGAEVMNDFADALLKRDWTAVTGEAERSVLKALRFLRNKWNVSIAGLLTIYKEDDVTVSHTMDLTSDASADPVTGAEPN